MPTAIQALTLDKANFHAWIRRPEHTNQARMLSEKQQMLQTFECGQKESYPG